MTRPVGMRADTATSATFKTLITPAWAMEKKEDGFRMLATTGAGAPAGFNRKGERAVLPANVTAEMRNLGDVVVLDGEYAQGVYYVFDLLEINNVDLRAEPWARRNLQMRHLLDHWSPSEAVVQRVQFVREQAAKLDLLREIEAAGGEGAVFKRIDSIYEPGPRKSKLWQKYKFRADVDVVIIEAAHNGKANFTIAVADPAGDIELPGRVPGRVVGHTSALTGDGPTAKVGDVVTVTVTGLGASGQLVEAVTPRLRTDKTPAECGADQLDDLRRISR